MKVEAVNCPDKLARLAPDWRRLPTPSPMQSPEWLLAWWNAYGKPERGVEHELCVLTVRDSEGRLVGLAPWRLEKRSLAGPTLRWLGDGRASSDHHTLLCGAEDREEMVESIADWLITHAGDTWRRVRFEAITDNDLAMHALQRRLADAQLDTEWIDDHGLYTAVLSESDEPTAWNDYLNSRSKNRRKRLRRWTRELFESGRATVRRVTTEEERQLMWPLLVRLHRERREAMGHASVFDEERFNAFHQEASAALLAASQLYFALLEFDGEPAAIEYALQDSRAVYAYQGGIANWALGHDVGHLSMLAMLHHTLDTGRTRYDLLRGDEPYKISWGAVRRQARTLHVRPRTLSGALERWAGNAYRGLRDARRGGKMIEDRG